jgi:hypothetical protein
VLDDEPVVVETQECRASERVLGALVAQDRPVLHRGAISSHDRLPEPDLRQVLLLGEGALDVAARILGLAERVRAKDRAVGVTRRDRLDVVRGPASLPRVDPGARSLGDAQ